MMFKTIIIQLYKYADLPYNGTETAERKLLKRRVVIIEEKNSSYCYFYFVIFLLSGVARR